jgi:DNA-binding transcriptional regulator YhcF (GntR family)
LFQVALALLWKFHNARTGLCIPSYETIAAAARVSTDTVRRAIDALQAAGVLTWVNRLKRVWDGGCINQELCTKKIALIRKGFFVA